MENNLSSKFDRLDLNTSESNRDSKIDRTCSASTMPAPVSEALMKSSGVLELDTNAKQCKFVILGVLMNGFRINLNHQPFSQRKHISTKLGTTNFSSMATGSRCFYVTSSLVYLRK